MPQLFRSLRDTFGKSNVSAETKTEAAPADPPARRLAEITLTSSAVLSRHTSSLAGDVGTGAALVSRVIPATPSHASYTRQSTPTSSMAGSFAGYGRVASNLSQGGRTGYGLAHSSVGGPAQLGTPGYRGLWGGAASQTPMPADSCSYGVPRVSPPSLMKAVSPTPDPCRPLVDASVSPSERSRGGDSTGPLPSHRHSSEPALLEMSGTTSPSPALARGLSVHGRRVPASAVGQLYPAPAPLRSAAAAVPPPGVALIPKRTRGATFTACGAAPAAMSPARSPSAPQLTPDVTPQRAERLALMADLYGTPRMFHFEDEADASVGRLRADISTLEAQRV